MIARNGLAALAMAVLPAAVMGAPVYTATGFADYFDDGAGGFEGDFFDAGTDDIDVALSGAFDGADLLADLLVSDSTGALLEGSGLRSPALDLDGEENLLSFVVTDLTGSDASTFPFGAQIDVRFSDADDDGTVIDPVSVEISVAPIPVPASLPLLLVGAGALFALRRRT